MKYQSGSLVSVRGRDWVVQPDSTKELLIVKPLDGNNDETTGILMALEGEQVKPATFEPPKPEQLGDARSCALLRDALRIGVRNSAGPFRSFGKIAVQPRPYQLLPLMMGLKLDPVRLLIADDVGIGKTIESCLLARELIDRGECRRLAVLCPPHLAEQWQRELFEKFHIDAKLVLSNTVKQLDAECLQSESIFDVFRYTVVSIDFIKSDRRREDFLRDPPDFVIVDEAHAASTDTGNSARHQRYELIRRLCDDPKRHVVLVTATPHSGNEGAFRSLLGLLDKEFLNYPADMSGEKNRRYRQEIAKHFIQRRRADILHFLEDKTEFPTPQYSERKYDLGEEYHKLFEETTTELPVVDDEQNKDVLKIRELNGAIEEKDQVLEDLKKQLSNSQGKIWDQGVNLKNLYGRILKNVLSPKLDAHITLPPKHDIHFGIQESTAILAGEAVESLSLILFDITAVLWSVEGNGSHPCFLLHDSPREADLEAPVYNQFLANIHALSQGLGGKNAPFQYIVTTTTEPPKNLQDDGVIRESLSAHPPENMLFRKVLEVPALFDEENEIEQNGETDEFDDSDDL